MFIAQTLKCVLSVIDGCRSYDSRLPECRECYEQGIDGSNRNFNVCNKKLHTEDALNKMKHTHIIKLNDCKIKEP